jgi:nucleotide-binding universal stress UspA family protein
MNAKDVIRQVIEFGDMVMRAYVADLTDAELLVRSVPGSNHIAWQLGHLIGGVHSMLADIGRSAPALPDGFVAAHGRETAASDDPAKFSKKAEYLALMDQMKAASLAAVDATPESELDAPSPEAMREYAPTIAAVLMVLGAHPLMHAGQFVPIRRKLGKPPLF